MRRTVAAALVVAVAILASSSPIAAQQLSPPKDTIWVAVQSSMVDWTKMDSLVKLNRMYTLPAAAEAKKAGVLLDFSILVHAYGSEWNYQVIRKFRHWNDIATDTSYGAAFRRLNPDTTRRRAITQAFTWASGDGKHRDEIFREVRP